MPFIPIPRSELEQPLPDAGTYPCRIDKISSKKSSNQNDMLMVIWTIMGTEPPAGMKFPEQITLLPESYWRLNELMVGCQYTPGETGFQTEELIGKECKVTIVHDTWEGQPRVKVTKHLPL